MREKLWVTTVLGLILVRLLPLAFAGAPCVSVSYYVEKYGCPGIVPAPSVVESYLARGESPPNVSDWACPMQVGGIIGEKKLLVIMIDFSDRIGVQTRSYFDSLFFSNNQGSLRHYYNEVSYGLLSVTGAIAGAGWYRSSHAMTWYGTDSNMSLDRIDNYYTDIFELAKEAVTLANADVDFSAYDTDQDGAIQSSELSLCIVHGGSDQAQTGVSTDIWSAHSAILGEGRLGHDGPLHDLVVDGVRISLHYGEPDFFVGAFSTMAENSPIGTIAHEFGHDLGLPDLYDRVFIPSDGVGDWDLMGSGSWLGTPGGSCPAHLSAWSKAQLGWITPTVFSSYAHGVVIPQVENNPAIYKFVFSSNEYFLLENREQTGYDTFLPGSGLLIWHIDDSVPDNGNQDHKRVDLEEGHGGTQDLDVDDANRGDADDPYNLDFEGFTDSTDPNSKSYGGNPTGLSVTNVSAAGSIMTVDLLLDPADFSVANVVPLEPHYTVVQIYHGEMRVDGICRTMDYRVTVSRSEIGPATLFGRVGLKRVNCANHALLRIVDNEQDFSLTYGGSFTCSFCWSEPGTLTSGYWAIVGYVEVISPGYYDANPLDNELANGTVEAKELQGDVDGDGVVDIFDAIAFAGAFGTTNSSGNWNPDCNFQSSEPEVIDILDAIVIGGHFGWTIDSGSQEGGSGSSSLGGIYTMDGQGGNVIVSVEPAQLTVYKGETFAVSARITDVMDLYGWEFKLYWNNTILNCTNAVVQTPSAWTNSTLDFGDGLEANYNSTHGCFWKALTAKNPATSFTGSLTMVTFTFQANAEGTTLLLLQDCKLGNSTAQPITFTQTDGSVTVFCGRYMRGDTRTINGLNAYVLNATESASPQSYGNEVSGLVTVYWGIKAWVRHSNGVEAAITLDGQTSSPKAVVSRTRNSGMQSSTVSVSGTSLQSTDSLVVRVYMKFGSGSWAQCASFTTEQLQGSSLQTATWTVYYYTSASQNRVDQTTSGTFYWGDTTYYSRIQNLQCS